MWKSGSGGNPPHLSPEAREMINLQCSSIIKTGCCQPVNGEPVYCREMLESLFYPFLLTFLDCKLYLKYCCKNIKISYYCNCKIQSDPVFYHAHDLFVLVDGDCPFHLKGCLRSWWRLFGVNICQINKSELPSLMIEESAAGHEAHWRPHRHTIFQRKTECSFVDLLLSGGQSAV